MTIDSSFYVYSLKRPNGVPFYIGKGKGKRCYTHLKSWHLKQDENTFKVHIIEKIRRNGQEPSVEILQENMTETDAFKLEAQQIQLHGRVKNGGILVNMSDGGEGQTGHPCSEESKKKISAHMRGENNPFFGKKHTKESLKLIGDVNRGKILGEEWKRKLSEATKGRPKSEETKKRMSLSAIGKRKSPEHIKKITDAQRGKIISEDQRRKIREALFKRKLLGLPIGRPKTR
jgi:hypothetical protein